MPGVSEPQRKAMQAAAHGKSTLGIPPSVGKKFVAADRVKSQGKKGPFHLPPRKKKPVGGTPLKAAPSGKSPSSAYAIEGIDN